MKQLTKRFIEYMEYYGKIKSRQVLLTLSDRQLEDSGISKQLLLQGTSQWPWRVEDQPTALVTPLHVATLSEASPALTSDKATHQVINDLEAMTDRELMDMGISRGEIRHAVRYGLEEKAA